MNTIYLNEHDAQQGAESQGEFLGMSGNCAWFLFGALGATIFMVTVLWGVCGVPLIACMIAGLVLCAVALTYVFTLKNNRPAHYDTDFFESTMVEAGVMALAFGPREHRPLNPFRAASATAEPGLVRSPKRSVSVARNEAVRSTLAAPTGRSAVQVSSPTKKSEREPDEARTVPLAAYERLRNQLDTAEETLEDVIAAREEEGL